jgi:4-amino-4-deoxy-L-arabinose transferase-like glycosyltransferase
MMRETHLLEHSIAPLDATELRRQSWQERGILSLLVTLGAVLRFVALGRQPLWLDEATDAAFARQSFWKCVFAEAVHPPLYRALLHFIVVRSGDSAVAVRFLPALFGVLTIPAMVILARRLFPGTEIAAAALAATSPFLIFFSQENRDYSLFILLTVLATWAFWRFCESGRGLPLYTALSILLVYTHYLAMFVLLAHEIVFWWRERRSPRDWMLARAAVFCAVAPWLLWAAGRYHEESRMFVAPALLIPSTLLRFFVGYGIAPSDAVRKAQPWSSKIVSEGPIVVPAFCLFAWVLWRGARRAVARPRLTILLTCILLLPWATLVILAPWIKLTQERYLAFQAPFVLLLIAAGLDSLLTRGRAIVGAMLALVIAFSLTAYYGAPGARFGYRFRYGKENWAGAAAFVRQEHPDVVILAPGYLYLPFDRYPIGQSREIRTTAGVFSPPDVHARGVALILSHAGPAEERLRTELDATYPRIAEATFPAQNLIRVIVYDTSSSLLRAGDAQALK